MSETENQNSPGAKARARAILKAARDKIVEREKMNAEKPWNTPLPKPDAEFKPKKGFNMVQCDKCNWKLNANAFDPVVIAARLERHKKAKGH